MPDGQCNQCDGTVCATTAAPVADTVAYTTATGGAEQACVDNPVTPEEKQACLDHETKEADNVAGDCTYGTFNEVTIGDDSAAIFTLPTNCDQIDITFST